MGNVYMHGHAQRATNQRLDCGLHSHLLGLLLAWMDAVRPIVRAFPPPKSCMPGIYTDVMAIPEVCLENRFGGFMAHAQEQATNYRTNKTKRKKKRKYIWRRGHKKYNISFVLPPSQVSVLLRQHHPRWVTYRNPNNDNQKTPKKTNQKIKDVAEPSFGGNQSKDSLRASWLAIQNSCYEYCTWLPIIVGPVFNTWLRCCCPVATLPTLCQLSLRSYSCRYRLRIYWLQLTSW